MTFLPFGLLLIAVLGLWIHRGLSLAALGLAIIAGYFTGALSDLAALWIVMLGAMAVDSWRSAHAGCQRVAHAASCFSCSPLPLGTAAVPGLSAHRAGGECRALARRRCPTASGWAFAKVVDGHFHPGLHASRNACVPGASWDRCWTRGARVAGDGRRRHGADAGAGLREASIPSGRRCSSPGRSQICSSPVCPKRHFSAASCSASSREVGGNRRVVRGDSDRGELAICSDSCISAAAGSTRWRRRWRAWATASPITARSALKRPWPCTSA